MIYASDLFSKFWVRRAMPLGAEIRLLPFFSLTHVENTGIAFGMLQQMNHLLLIAGAALTALLVWMAVRSRSKDRFTTLVLAGILGGAAGNLTDRVLQARVTDFFDFYIGPHHWPAFNVADSAICVGAGLLILHGLKRTE